MIKNILYNIICVPLYVFIKIKYRKESFSYKDTLYFLKRDIPSYFARKELNNSEWPNIKTLDYSKYKKSDTVFIVGSGTSINDISEEQWKHINKHDIICLNQSFMNKNFKPTIAFLEFAKMKEIREIAYKNWKNDAIYQNIPQIFSYLNIKAHILDKEEFSNFEYLKDYYCQVPYFHSIPNKRILFDLIKFREKSKIFPLNNETLIHHLGSINKILNFCYLEGYKEIICLGLDMNNSRYFYEISEYDKVANIQYLRDFVPNDKKDKNHGNADPKNYKGGFVPGDEYIKEFNDLILKPKGIQLFIGSKKAKLYPDLPYYFEKENL
ncbi:hypothetical protein UJ101_00312 [Flavobacteriaceae bacterium UJ101]|nr:hypothetical protein UJ101_00312 [Flavobacteriaceae bacterium UJ101]